MTARAWIAECAMLFVMLAPHPASSQNPCAEIGSDCRVMTAAEKKGYEQRMAALEKVLPVPDPEIYTQSSLGAYVESMTTPAIAMMNQMEPVLTCRSWPTGCFPEEASFWFTYGRKEDVAKGSEKTEDLVELSQRMATEFANQIEVNAWLRPHPHLVANVGGKCVDVEDPSATIIETTTTFLSYRTGDETVETLYMIFGPRTCNENDVLTIEQPSPRFAPVVSVEIQISGPPRVVSELAGTVDRKACEALLGPVVR